MYFWVIYVQIATCWLPDRKQVVFAPGHHPGLWWWGNSSSKIHRITALPLISWSTQFWSPRGRSAAGVTPTVFDEHLTTTSGPHEHSLTTCQVRNSLTTCSGHPHPNSQIPSELLKWRLWPKYCSDLDGEKSSHSSEWYPQITFCVEQDPTLQKILSFEELKLWPISGPRTCDFFARAKFIFSFASWRRLLICTWSRHLHVKMLDNFLNCF